MILTESRYGQQGRKLMEEIRKRAPKMKINLLDPTMSKTDLDQVRDAAANSSAVYVAAYVTVSAYRGNVALAGEFTGFVNDLLAARPPVSLIALGNPYLVRSFPTVKTYATTYSTTTTSETAAAKALFGEIPLTGRLPVTIPGIAKYGDGIQLPAITSQKGL